jgi:flagellar biosynthesis protein FlhB
VSGARTEAPTPRRLREARRRGEVARSADLGAAAALAGGLLALALLGPGIASDLARALRAAVAAPAAPPPADALRGAAVLVLRLAVPPAACAAACAVLAGAVQTGFAFSAEAARPRLARLDPLRGLARLVDPAQAARTALAVVKAAVLVLLLAGWWRGAARAVVALPRAAAPGALAAALPLLAGLGLRLAAALALLGAAELALEARRVRRALRMTRDEVRRELREDEGDPAHRAERRRLHHALLATTPVARATVVVVNPTHLAVALRHERGGAEAPRVVAKGSGRAAARLRSAARRAGVPIVRDVLLARALHRLADVGDEIPEELYDAAAALLAHLYAAPEAP